MTAVDLAPELVRLDTVNPPGREEAAGRLAHFTDAAALTPAFGDPPTVIWGPGEAAQAHQTDGWAEAAKIGAAADAYAEVARRWCGV